MYKPLIEINDWSGGMTLKSDVGNANQFDRGYNVDFLAKKGKLTCNRSYERGELTSSVEMPTQFKDIIGGSDGKIYAGGGDTKIYDLSAFATIAVANDSAQTGEVNGMMEYKGDMYYAQSTTIGKFDLSSTWEDDWQTGIEAAVHRMHVATDNNLYITNGKYVAKFDGTTFTSDVLDLSDGWIVNDLNDFGEAYLAVGATFYAGANKPVKSRIFLWDKVSDTWVDEINIPEKEIHALEFSAGYLWVWAGGSANAYVIPDGSRKATKMTDFNTESEVELRVYPGAVTHRNGMIYFGLSDNAVASDINKIIHPSAPCGIYAFPADPNNFSLNRVFKNADNSNIYYSVNHIATASGFGSIYFSEHYYASPIADHDYVRREDTGSGSSLYVSPGQVETFEYTAPANKRMMTEAFGIEFESLPASTNIQLEYQADNDGTWTVLFLAQITGATEEIKYKHIKAKSLKLRIVITGTAAVNTYARPYVKRVFVTGNLIGRTKWN